MFRSDYFKNVLSITDRYLFMTLIDNVLTSKNGHYKNGFLLINAKHDTLSERSNIPVATLRRSLYRLDKLGVIVTIKQKGCNNKHLLGFRAKNSDWLLFIHYLVNTYDTVVKNVIENNETITKEDTYKYFSIPGNVTEYIKNNFDKEDFFSNVGGNNKTICETLFHRRDYYSEPKLKIVKNG